MKAEIIHNTGGFVWTNPEVRCSDDEIDEYLKENPNGLINRGDGKGWLGIKANHKTLINKPKTVATEVKKTIRRNSGNSILIMCDGMLWQEKHDLVKAKIEEQFGEVPAHVSFEKMKMNSGKCTQNPDGVRLLVKIIGLARQRNYDYKGKIKVHKILHEIGLVMPEKA